MSLSRSQVRCVLTIAGSDSGGGAGLEADLNTFLSHKVHGTAAVTCVTAQNTLGVRAMERVPPALILAQINAVLVDFRPEAAKTGFLASFGAVEAIGSLAESLPQLVVDPVCVDKHGRQILDDATVEAIRRILLPRAALITPNIAEAAILTGQPVNTPQEMESAANALLELGAPAALVKGGRLGIDHCPDLFVAQDGSREWLDAPRVTTTAVLGTGDTLSAAIACRLAWGSSLIEAVRLSKSYVTACLNVSLEIGQGQGPIGHETADQTKL